MDGNVIGRTTINPSNIVEGSRVIIASKQLEVRVFTDVYLYNIIYTKEFDKVKILDNRTNIWRVTCIREEFRANSRGTIAEEIENMSYT